MEGGREEEKGYEEEGSKDKRKLRRQSKETERRRESIEEGFDFGISTYSDSFSFFFLHIGLLHSVVSTGRCRLVPGI